MKQTNIFKNKTILITGGTGFLGRALTGEILKQHPQSIRLFSRDELKHYKCQELFGDNSRIRNFIGDVRDYPRLLKATRNADIVIHAAALKRVDLIEYNVEESIKTNIIGTLNVVNACLANQVEKAIFVSTDKACSPINTYGACKFVSERIFSETNYSKGDLETIFSIVRYGNVLESTGSVIPYFMEKIKKGEEIPLTDPRMTRFVISSKQAVDLIFKAVVYCQGGEVFVPKLPSLKIIDLIEVLKEQYQASNKIRIVGVRPGEKIHELLINESEIARTIEFKGLYVIRSCIRKNSDKKRLFYSGGEKKIDEKKMREYSSKDYILSRERIKKLFQKEELI